MVLSTSISALFPTLWLSPHFVHTCGPVMNSGLVLRRGPITTVRRAYGVFHQSNDLAWPWTLRGAYTDLEKGRLAWPVWAETWHRFVRSNRELACSSWTSWKQRNTHKYGRQKNVKNSKRIKTAANQCAARSRTDARTASGGINPVKINQYSINKNCIAHTLESVGGWTLNSIQNMISKMGKGIK